VRFLSLFQFGDSFSLFCQFPLTAEDHRNHRHQTEKSSCDEEAEYDQNKRTSQLVSPEEV
jgi:hypothetical protein